MTYAVIALISVLVAACAQMLLKRSARYEHTRWWRQYVNGWVITGYAVMFITMVVNIWCLHNGLLLKELSVIESLSYLFVPFLSWYIFDEPVSRRKALAIGVIIVGVIVFFL